MITGRVDDYGRALVPIRVGHPRTTATLTLDAWIDTGFTGGLLLTAAQVATLGLSPSSTLPGTFADGSRVLFETFGCLIEWFSGRRPVEAIAGSGPFALLGVTLLEDCTVVIDYPARQLTLALLSGPPQGP